MGVSNMSCNVFLPSQYKNLAPVKWVKQFTTHLKYKFSAKSILSKDLDFRFSLGVI